MQIKHEKQGDYLPITGQAGSPKEEEVKKPTTHFLIAIKYIWKPLGQEQGILREAAITVSGKMKLEDAYKILVNEAGGEGFITEIKILPEVEV